MRRSKARLETQVNKVPVGTSAMTEAGFTGTSTVDKMVDHMRASFFSA